MSIIWRFQLWLLLVVFLPQASRADVLHFDRYKAFHQWSAAEHDLLADLADSQLGNYTLLEAALVIAGHGTDRMTTFKTVFSASLARCRQKLGVGDHRDEQLRTLFQHLNEEFLYGQYQPELYDVGQTLENGDFNCLTATILFYSLCQAQAIQVQVVWEPSHVQCWVPTSESTGILVETTASAATHAVGPQMPSSQLADRRLSISQLVAKVFYNRGVCELRRQNFRHALATTWVSSMLDPGDEPARNNHRACLNNWAFAASQRNDLVLARRLLEARQSFAPDRME